MPDRRPMTALLLTLVLLALPRPTAAQDAPEATPQERLFRGGVGLLVGSAGLGAALDLTMNHGARVYRVRLSGHDNAIASWQSEESVSVSETGFMIGRGHRFTRNYGSLSAGLALTEVRRGPGEGEGTTTLGLPVEAQLVSGGWLKLGATLAGNLNLERSFAALVLSVQLGRLPER